MSNHVFISYARRDQTYVRNLADDLCKRGFEVWIDDRIDFGDRWWREIVKAVQNSAAFVVVMSPDAKESEWVEREVLLAQREKKPIFPLLLRGKELPILITTQYVNVTNSQMPPDRFYERLGRVVKPSRESLPPTPALVAPPRPQPTTSTRQPIEQPQPTPPTRQPFEPEMILIPAGEFLMGSDPAKDENAQKEEQPQHKLYLPDYYIAKTPVTQAQYAAFVRATGYRAPDDNWRGQTPPPGKENHPVVLVTWDDAVAYCRWLSGVTNKLYRLPSEAEWEKAARGPDGRIYPWGNSWDKQRCNTEEGGRGDTTPVGGQPLRRVGYGW